MSRVGEKVKKARLENKLTQKQLGKKLGVSETFINEVETGKKILNEKLIDRISKVLNTDINDISMYSEEPVYDETPKKAPENKSFKEHKDNKEVNEIWNKAFGDVLKNVPIYDYSLSNVLSFRQMPVYSNKIEGYPQDKVFFISIEDDDMLGFRIAKGDLAFCHAIKEVQNNSIYLLEINNERFVRQVKKLDSTKILLVSNKASVKAETVNIKEAHVLGKVDKIEIQL